MTTKQMLWTAFGFNKQLYRYLGRPNWHWVWLFASSHYVRDLAWCISTGTAFNAPSFGTALAEWWRDAHRDCIADTWSFMVSWLSRIKPRSWTVDEKFILADSRDSSVTESLSSCCVVPSHISCVLAFILSRLLLIHASMHSTVLQLALSY